MAEPLWQGSEAIAALDGLLTAAPRADWTADGVSIDTRSLQRGDIFVALPGEKVDGHAFVLPAFEAGAAAALVQDGFAADLPDGAVLLPVPDVLAALEALGRAARARSRAQIAAVTGSVGKTGVKQSLAAALAGSGKTHAAEKSFNNHIGVPLTLARLPADADYAVFELGMNHAGEIAALVDMVRPHVAIITTIGSAHIEHFASMQDLAAAKAEIIGGLTAGGTAVLPRDNEFYPQLAAAAQGVETVAFSADGAEDAAARVLQARLHDRCSCVTAIIGGDEIAYKVGAAGRHHISNSLAVLAAVQRLGGDMALAALSLADSVGLAGRGRRHNIGHDEAPVTLIDESYNANPTSMAAALEALGLVPRLGRGRRIAVLGDMAELGEHAPAMHAGLADAVTAAEIDLVITCGPLMRHLHEHLPAGCMGPHFAERGELIAALQRSLQADDVVMVKGSNASGMGAVVDALLAQAEQRQKNEGVG